MTLHLMMTSSKGNIFRVTGPLCGELTGHRWFPLTKASGAELCCFLWIAPEQTVDNRRLPSLGKEATGDRPLSKSVMTKFYTCTMLCFMNGKIFSFHNHAITTMRFFYSNFTYAMNKIFLLYTHRPQKVFGHSLLCGLNGNHQIWNAIFQIMLFKI